MNIKQLLTDKKIRNLLFGLLVIAAIESVSFSALQVSLWLKLPIFLVIIYLWGREAIYWGLKSAIKLKFSNINLLMTIAIVGAVLLQKFEEAAVIVVLFGLGVITKL